VNVRSMRFVAEASALRGMVFLARHLPRRALLSLGSGFGALWYLLDARHRRVALGNLGTAFGPALNRNDARRIVRNCWRHYGRTLFDVLAFDRFSAASVGTLVQYEGLEHIRAAYARGKGVVLFSAHYGHWELTALMQGYLGIPLTMVTRPLDNPALEGELARLRGRSGNAILHRRNAVREMLKTLRRGGGIAILIDQDAHGGGVFVPFFGRASSTTPTLATLALRTGAAVIPTFSIPLGNGTYRVIYEREVEIRDTGDRDADVIRITAECTAIIERWVRRHPELWLWMHRRWKTPPPENGEREEHAATSHLHGS